MRCSKQSEMFDQVERIGIAGKQSRYGSISLRCTPAIVRRIVKKDDYYYLYLLRSDLGLILE